MGVVTGPRVCAQRRRVSAALDAVAASWTMGSEEDGSAAQPDDMPP